MSIAFSTIYICKCHLFAKEDFLSFYVFMRQNLLNKIVSRPLCLSSFFADDDFLFHSKRPKMAAGNSSDVQIVFDSNISKAPGVTQHVHREVGEEGVRRGVRKGGGEVSQRQDRDNSFEAIHNILISKLKTRESGCLNVFGDCGNNRLSQTSIRPVT